MPTKSLILPFRFSSRGATPWMNVGRVLGVLGGLAIAASKIVVWAKRRRRENARALPLDLADLTEVASIPPPAPAPRHHPRVPSLVRPDVHAFEAAPQALAAPGQHSGVTPPR